MTTELYPFSRAPMFADAPRQYCEYTICLPDGRQLSEPGDDLRPFGLQRNYWGNPLGVGVGFEPAQSVDVFGTVPARQNMVRVVAERLMQFPDLKYVDIEIGVVGPIDRDHIGMMWMARWRVDNPHYQPGAGA